MDNKIIIVCSGNKNYITPMKVMLKSVVINTVTPINVFILIFDWKEEDKKSFQYTFINDQVHFTFIEVEQYECLKNFKTNQDITIESYFRLFIPKLLPSTINHIIYLDGDIIVEGDIQELWNIPMKDKSIMAVPEMFSGAHFVSSPYALRTYKDLKIPKWNRYFNAGVLKINIDKWRNKDITSKIVNYLIEYKDKILWHDQDGLNAVLWDDWEELPYEWNVMTALFYEEDYNRIEIDKETATYMMKFPKLIHYTNSEDKPWKDTCTHPLKERFNYYKGFLLAKKKIE